jgi:hypothetical protein
MKNSRQELFKQVIIPAKKGLEVQQIEKEIAMENKGY